MGGACGRKEAASPIFRFSQDPSSQLVTRGLLLPALLLCLSRYPGEGSRAWSRGTQGAAILSTG